MPVKGNTSTFSTAAMYIQISKATKKGEMYCENSSSHMPTVFTMVTILIYQAATIFILLQLKGGGDPKGMP